MNKNVKKRDISLDILRTCAIIAVIALHSDQITLSATNYVGGKSWWIVLLLNSINKTAVPVFIMISGALVLEKYNYSTYKQILSKTIHRILVPLLLWTILYLSWRSYHFGDLTSEIIFRKIISGDVYHLYFLIVIGGLYLTIPVWNYFISKHSNHLLLITSLSALILTWINYFILNQPTLGNSLFLFLPYSCYFIAGSLLKPVSKTKASLFIVLAIVVSFISGFIYYLSLGDINSNLKSIWWTSSNAYYLWDSFSPTIMLSSYLLFISFRSFDWKLFKKNTVLSRIVLFISINTFGVYLIHPIILDLLDHYGHMAIHLVTSSLLIHFLKRVFLTFSISLIVSYLLSKTKSIKLFIGL